MSSRSAILKELRRNLPEAAPLPSLEGEPWVVYEDPIAQFREVLEGVGGTFLKVASTDEADAEVRRLPSWNEETRSGQAKRVSLVPGVGETTFDYEGVSDPHDLEDVDFAVLPAHFMVAENGAVWVTAEDPKQRVLNFLSQHVAYVVGGPDPVVHTMHAAYERADPRAQPFSVFVSGPSKTADIEQSLVIGAHGARSLAVLMIE